MRDGFRNGAACRFRAIPPAAGLLLAAGSAWAEAPPLPFDIGPGSLPGTRAAAAAEAGTEPGTSPELRLRGFGLPTAAPPPEPEEQRRSLTITPSIGAQVLATDNVFQSSRDRRSDIITTITPSLTASADTPYFQGVLNYSPNIQLYGSTTSENRVDQRLNGQGLATLVPDLLYLDLRGASAVQAITGGIAPESTIITDRRNRVQTNSFQISPYVLQRFGELATVQVGYAFQYVDQSSTTRGEQISVPPGGLPSFLDQNFTAHEFYAVGRTGPEFGRLALEARLDSTSYSGTGVLDGAYRRFATLEARYAIVRGIYALVEGGYEEQRYGGTPGLHINEPVWSAGFRIDFSDESRITAKYGRRDGFDSAFLQASLGLGGRTRLVANYDERLTTSARRAGDLLTTTTLDDLGNPIDIRTGSPAIQPFANSFLGVQSSLVRVRNAAATLVQSWPRDTITLGFSYQEQKPISVALGTTGYEQRGTSVSASYAHALTERTTATAYLQYGTFRTGLFGKGDLITASLALSHELQPGLFGTVQVATSSRGDDRSSGRATQNLVLLAIRKTF